METTSRSSWIEAFEASLEPSPASRRSADRVAARSRSMHYYGREATARQPHLAPDSHETKAAPELKVVTRRSPRRGLIVVLVGMAAILIMAGIVSPVLVSAAATGMEAEVGRLEAQVKDLTATSSGLAAHVSALAAPDRVAGQAAELGLGPAVRVHYVDVFDVDAGMAFAEPAGTQAGAAVTKGEAIVVDR
jgi:cell division protein FtsL